MLKKLASVRFWLLLRASLLWGSGTVTGTHPPGESRDAPSSPLFSARRFILAHVSAVVHAEPFYSHCNRGGPPTQPAPVF